MAFNFAGIFRPNGGISHGGAGGQVTAIPSASPQQQLSGGTAAPAPAPAPEPDPLNSHLDGMAGVWQTPKDAEGKPIAAPADPLAQQIYSFKPEDVSKAADRLDFTSGINPELLAKAAGGDVDALREALNATVRAGFVGTTVNTGRLINDGFQKHGQAIDAALPSRIRNHQVASMKTDDPILSHPAVQPMYQSLRAIIATNNPNLGAEEANKMAEDWVRGLGQAVSMSTDSGTGGPKKVEKEMDWLKFADLDTSK